MPRFFFDLHNGETESHDGEGQEMPDVQAALNEAIAVLPDMLRGRILREGQRDLVSSVRDESGRTVFRATLSLSTERMVPAELRQNAAPTRSR